MSDRVIIDACVTAGHRYRVRRITPVLTVLHMIAAAIWPEDSFVASWQLLWSSFIAAFPCLGRKSPSRGVVANARKRLPLAVWNRVVTWLCQQSQKHSEPIARWRSHRVVAADRIDVMRISFVGAVRAIITFAPSLALRPPWQLPMIYEAMLSEIASNLVPERPGRVEPRKVTHDPRGYPKLKTTREQWRKLYAA